MFFGRAKVPDILKPFPRELAGEFSKYKVLLGSDWEKLYQVDTQTVLIFIRLYDMKSYNIFCLLLADEHLPNPMYNV